VRTSPGLCDGHGTCEPGLEHECPSGACLGDVCAPDDNPADGGQDGDGGTADGGDEAPVDLRAEAGPIQVVRPGSLVTLDGSGSSGPTGASLSYLWEQTSGPATAELAGSTTARATFSAQLEGVYSFKLVVGDGDQESAPDFTEVHVMAKGGGCGCGASAGGGWLAWALLAAFALRRRRTS
jgi:MYXO-CTERM domain-containing protein